MSAAVRSRPCGLPGNTAYGKGGSLPLAATAGADQAHPGVFRCPLCGGAPPQRPPNPLIHPPGRAAKIAAPPTPTGARGRKQPFGSPSLPLRPGLSSSSSLRCGSPASPACAKRQAHHPPRRVAAGRGTPPAPQRGAWAGASPALRSGLAPAGFKRGELLAKKTRRSDTCKTKGLAPLTI